MKVLNKDKRQDLLAVIGARRLYLWYPLGNTSIVYRRFMYIVIY